MKRCVRDSLAVIKALVEPAGVDVRLGSGGKHTIAFLTAPDGGVHRIPISASPLNPDHQIGNVRQQVRAWLEAQGLAAPRGQSAERAKRRHRRARVKSTIYRIEVGGSRIAEDPWAPLARLTGREP